MNIHTNKLKLLMALYRRLRDVYRNYECNRKGKSFINKIQPANLSLKSLVPNVSTVITTMVNHLISHASNTTSCGGNELKTNTRKVGKIKTLNAYTNT